MPSPLQSTRVLAIRCLSGFAFACSRLAEILGPLRVQQQCLGMPMPTLAMWHQLCIGIWWEGFLCVSVRTGPLQSFISSFRHVCHQSLCGWRSSLPSALTTSVEQLNAPCPGHHLWYTCAHLRGEAWVAHIFFL